MGDIKKLEEVREELQIQLMEELDINLNLEDDKLYALIEAAVLQKGKNRYLSVEEKQILKRELFNRFRKLDVLSELLEDESISEIMINGSNNIFIERKGKLYRAKEFFSNEERLRNVIQQIVSTCNRIVNETVPIVDARLSDGSRVNVVLPPVALNGAVMTIRKFPKLFFTMERLIDIGTITWEAASFLQSLVRAKYNIFISGGTGSGKTTFLNVLSNYIPADERVITIEDSAELQITQIPNLVRLETRNANIEGENEITMSQLIKTALRMRPDRIIVGEVRDAAAMDMANSMLTGHDGSISTGHGNSAKEMLLRLETMILMGYDMPILAIRQQIAAAVDIVIHLGRLRDNTRRVLEICEVLDVDQGEIQMNTLYQFSEQGEKDGKIVGELMPVNHLIKKEKMIQSGQAM
ncbi:MAG: CpaF family protein [Lachnospiraceae bacterium]|nr:CpaF family protein [Lachnospiraceae bacterium]